MDRVRGAELGGWLSLLDTQRMTLLSGDVLSLRANLSQLEEAASRVASGRYRRDDLDALRNAAERNARLLREAARGVRSVRRRMEELSDTRVSGTYDADGRRIAMSAMRTPPAR